MPGRLIGAAILESVNHCLGWDQLNAIVLHLQAVSEFLYTFGQCKMPVLHQRRLMETLVSILRCIDPELAQSIGTADPNVLLGKLLADLECMHGDEMPIRRLRQRHLQSTPAHN